MFDIDFHAVVLTEVHNMFSYCSGDTVMSVPMFFTARTAYNSGCADNSCETEILPVHCEHYHMDVNRKQKIPSETKTFKLKYFEKLSA